MKSNNYGLFSFYTISIFFYRYESGVNFSPL